MYGIMRNMVHYGIGTEYYTRIILASYTKLITTTVLSYTVPYGTVHVRYKRLRSCQYPFSVIPLIGNVLPENKKDFKKKEARNVDKNFHGIFTW
jgi:hypothetical protein